MKDIEETWVYGKGFVLRWAKTSVFGLIFQKDWNNHERGHNSKFSKFSLGFLCEEWQSRLQSGSWFHNYSTAPHLPMGLAVILFAMKNPSSLATTILSCEDAYLLWLYRISLI